MLYGTPEQPRGSFNPCSAFEYKTQLPKPTRPVIERRRLHHKHFLLQQGIKKHTLYIYVSGLKILDGTD